MKMTAVKNIILMTLMSFTATFAFGQENWEGHKYGKDTARAQKSEAMFGQYFKAKDYQEAFPYWEYLFNNAPVVSKRVTFNGAFMVKKQLFHLKNTDSAGFEKRKDGLIDTIMLTYDMRIKYWGEKDIVMAKKASDMFQLLPQYRDSAMNMFAESVKNLGYDTEYKTTLYYLQSAITENKRDKYSIDSLFDLYFQLQEIVGHNVQEGGKSKNKWVACDTTLTKMMRPFFTCEKIEEFFKPKTDSTPNDLGQLKRVTNLLAIAKCNKSEYALDVAVKIYELEPSSNAAINIAKTYKAIGNNEEALSWYNKGIDGVSDTTEKADIYQTMASLEYSAGNISSAKNFANKVLALNPNNGNAHLIIASSYAKSAGSCKADGIDGLSVYWAAVDRAVKAKTVDPSVSEQANKFINVYAPYFVKGEQAFFKNFPVPEGGTYIVPCLGVSTIVRFSK
ncbi:MAG: tetratricopeptide (TPR) repeat protein [Bacteroidia bacterium]|jgi:tetratricopeptide (TPR) repeat protein